MLMLVGSLGALANAVQSSADYSAGRATASEQAHVILERIARTVSEATANEKFPGIAVVATTVGSYRYPDALVVWHPEPSVLAAYPARLPLTDPARLPYYDELVIYTPDPQNAGRLLEIRSTAATQLSSDSSTWSAVVTAFRNGRVLDTNVFTGTGGGTGSYPAVTLTESLRSCVPSGASGTTRGALRFESRLRPSNGLWNDTTIPWEQLPWVQGVFGPQVGLRQAWVRIELQLVCPRASGSPEAIPFFGSAALYYPMYKARRP